MSMICKRYTGLTIFAVALLFIASATPEAAYPGRDPEPTLMQYVAESGQFTGHSREIHESLGPGHFCGTDFNSVDARAAQARFLAAKKNGSLKRVGKFINPPNIGDETQFRIIEDLQTDSPYWRQKTFRLVDKEPDAFYFWVDLEELNQLDGNELASIRTALLESTPAGSVAPDRGILFNNETYFGDPPNYDGDNHTDILFYDVAGQSSIAGFVSAADIDPLAPDTVGNQADVLYLDSRVGINSLAPIAAHEHTHLLHLASGSDVNYTFSSEGFAEYAIVMNGYTNWRLISYLNAFDDQEPPPNRYEYTRPLYGWRFDRTEDPQAFDYQRGNLFFGYIGDRFGPTAIGRMLQADKKGPEGVDSILVVEHSSLKELLPDFHTANFVNDRSIDVRYGYPLPGRPFVLATPTRTINGETLVDGPEGLEYITELEGENVLGGAAHYIQWQNVSDFDLEFDIFGALLFPDDVVAFQRRNLVGRVIGKRENGSLEFLEVAPQNGDYSFRGRFQSLTLLVTHVDPSIGVGGRYDVSARWVPLSMATASEPNRVPTDGFRVSQNYPNPFSAETTIDIHLDRPSVTRVSVFDILGRIVSRVIDKPLPAGKHSIVFDGSDLSSGIYFYRVESDGKSQTKSLRIVGR